MADNKSYVDKASKISTSVQDMSKVRIAPQSAKADKLMGGAWANYSNKAAQLIGPGNVPKTPSAIPSSTGFADAIPRTTPEEVKPAYSEWGAVGWGFRVLTGLGRVVLNTTATALHGAAEVAKAAEDGIQADEWGKVASGFGTLLTAGPVGAIKGLTYSVLPDAKKDIEKFTGGKVYDSYGEVMNTEDTRALGIPDISEEVYWDTALGGWTAKNTLATSMDILLDPATYFTLGLGGAVKGAARGLSTATRYAKAADKATVAARPLSSPRPFYSPLEKVAGKKLRTRVGNEIPLTEPKYTIANTNPYLYVLKEMGRGFSEAHQVAFDRWAAKGAARTFAKDFETNIENLNKTELVAEDLLKVGSDMIEQRLTLKKAQLEAEAKVSKETINELIAKEAENFNQALGNVLSPSGIKRLQNSIGARTLIRLEQAAADAGVEVPEQLVTRQAAELVRSLEGPSPLFRNATTTAKLRASIPIQKLADDMISSVRRTDGDPIAVWDEFRKNPQNAEFLKELDEIMTQPVGFRQTVAKKVDEAATPATTKGSESRKKGAGESQSRRRTREMAFLQTRQGNLQSKNKGMVWSGDNLTNDWLRIREAMGFDTTGTTAFSAAEITGDALSRAGVSMSLLSARIEWAANRLTGQGNEITFIENAASGGFNPLTARPEASRSYNMAANKTEESIAASLGRDLAPLDRATAWSLMQKAAGTIRDKKIRNILKKLGLKTSSFDAINGRVPLENISEDLSAVRMQKLLKAKEAIAKVASKKTIKISVNGKAKEVTANDVADLTDSEVLTVLDTALRRNKLRNEMVSDGELQQAVNYLTKVRIEKMQAIETLSQKGVDIFGAARPLFTVVTGRRGKEMGQLSRRNFKELFDSEKEGQSDVLMGQFIAYAYRSSSHRDSIDGGMFVEGIDELAVKAGLPPLETFNKIEDLAKALRILTADEQWTEFVTPPLLHSLEARTRSIGQAKTTGTLPYTGKTLKSEETRLVKRVETLLQKYSDDSIQAKLKQDGYSNNKIILEFRPGGRRDVSFLGLIDSGVQPRGIDIVNGDFAVGVKAADAVLNPRNIEYIDYIAIDPEVIKLVEALGVQPTIISAVIKDGKAVAAAAGEKATHVKLTGLIKEVQQKGYRSLNTIKKGLYQRLIGKQYQVATERALKAIAKSEVTQSMPLSLQTKEIFEFIKREIRVNATSIARVEANITARFWHASDLRVAEDLADQNILASPLSRTVSSGIKGPTVLAAGRKSFGKLVDKLEAAVTKDSPNLAKLEWDGEASIDKVISSGNPNLFISWLRKKEILTSLDRDQWTTAMIHMKNFTQLGGGNSPWRTYKEMIDSYPNRLNSALRPGQLNPETGLIVPTETQVLQVLQSLGIEDAGKMLLKEEIIGRSDVLKIVRNSKKHLNQLELEQAQFNDIFSSTLIAAGDDVRAITDALPTPETTVDQAMQMLASFQEELISAGEPWIMDLATYSGGRGLGYWTDMETVVAREAGELTRPVADIVHEDILGRIGRANFDQTEKGARDLVGEKNVRVLKSNFDIQNLYTADKVIFSTLSRIAESRGLLIGTTAREEFIGQYSALVIKARDLYFNARGIFPSSTLSLRKNQHNLTARAIGRDFQTMSKSEKNVLGSHAIFLTEGDFIDALGDDIYRAVYCQGSLNSFPLTSLFSPTRVLIMAQDALPPGAWFDETQIKNLHDIMMQLMTDDMKTISRGISKDNIKIKSLLNAEPELTVQKISLLVRHLLREDVATSLYNAHTINASYAIRRLQYEAGNVSAPIFEGLFKLLNSDLTSEGLNIQAVKNAAKELNDALGLATDDPLVEIIAKMDFNARMGARLQPLTATLMHESAKIETLSAEAKSIQELQGVANQARVDTLENLEPVIFENQLIIQATKAAENNATDDMIYEISVNALAEKQNILTNLRGYNLIDKFGRAFADYGMEDVRSIVNPITMNTKTVTSEFAEIVGRHVLNVQNKYSAFETQTGRNLTKEAFKKLQEMPDGVATTALNAADKLVAYAEAKAAGLTTGISKNAYSKLVDEARLLDEFISPDDAMLKEALKDLLIIHNRFLAGGEDSWIARNLAYDADFMNRNIREIGQGILRENVEVVSKVDGKVITNVKAAQDALKAGTADTRMVTKTDAYAFRQTKDAESFVNIWKEWDIENPYNMYVGLNSAAQKIIEVQSAAATFTKLFGFGKTTISREEAKAAGLVELVLPKKATPGNELLSYIPAGYYFPKAVVEQLKEVSKFMTEIKHLQATGSLEKAMIRIQILQDLAKKTMTQYTPKNWFQNTVGGYMANGLFFGIWSPMAYARSIAIGKSVGFDIEKELGLDPKSIESALANLDRRTAKGELQINPANDPTTSTSYTTRIGNKPVAIDLKDFWDLYVKTVGVVPHSQAGGQDLLREVQTLGKVKKPGLIKRGDKFLARWAGNRDDWLRLTAFVDIIIKGNWDNLEAAAQYAGKQVNRVHPQMQGLSTFNQKFTRNFVLFFTWRAKMLGAVITSVLDKPGAALTVLRLQQFMSEAQGAEYSGFGDFDPNNQLRPSYLKGNMNPTILNDEGRISSFTVSNPITDLLGQGSWLQALRFNNQDSLEQQIGQISYNTYKNFVTSSQPLLISAATDWVFEGKTQGGSPLTSGNRFTRKTLPLFVEDAMSKLGFGPYQVMGTLMFPGLIEKASQDGMNKDTINRKNWTTVYNWATGLKNTELDTIDIRKKAVQEILARRKDQAE